MNMYFYISINLFLGFGGEAIFLLFTAYARGKEMAIFCMCIAVGSSGFAISGKLISHSLIIPMFVLSFAHLTFLKKKLWDHLLTMVMNIQSLKALNTFGNCQRPVFPLDVSQHVHEITISDIKTQLIIEIAKEYFFERKKKHSSCQNMCANAYQRLQA